MSGINWNGGHYQVGGWIYLNKRIRVISELIVKPETLTVKTKCGKSIEIDRRDV